LQKSHKLKFELFFFVTFHTVSGSEITAGDSYFSSGPYGSEWEGEWFTDFWQSLDGSRIRPDHWPDAMNVRYGQRIDRYKFTVIIMCCLFIIT